MSTVGERLKTARARLGHSQEAFAKAAGIPLDTYKKYEGGSRMPGGEALRGIGTLGVDLLWLLSGESGTGHLAVSDPVAASYGYAHIPLLDVRARGGGHGELIEGEDPIESLAFKEDWIRRELRVLPSDLRLIYVEGDSMEPDLRSGDIILIDHTDTAARREGIYVLRMDNALLVKTLQRLPGGVIKVLSKNELYEPFSIKASEIDDSTDFAIIGRVVWACRRY